MTQLIPLSLELGCVHDAASLRFENPLDLSHAFDAETIFWPTEVGFAFERVSSGFTDRGYYYAGERSALSTSAS